MRWAVLLKKKRKEEEKSEVRALQKGFENLAHCKNNNKKIYITVAFYLLVNEMGLGNRKKGGPVPEDEKWHRNLTRFYSDSKREKHRIYP